jgi:hypothetical protein
MRFSWVGLLALVSLACSMPMPMPTARVADAARSTVMAARTTAVADGADTVTIVVTVLDAMGAPVPDGMIDVTVSGSDNQVEAPRPVGADGTTSVALRSTRAEEKRVTVTVQGVVLEAQPTIRFVAGPLASLRWDVQPTNGRLGQALVPAPTLSATDANGNAISMSDVTVALRLVRVQNATLMGGAARPLTQGQVRFEQLVATGMPQTGCALRAEASNGAATESARFDLAP